MPNIIDSLFLELGIDISKFSKDQAKALAEIQKFEAKAKKGGKEAGDAVKSVSGAFRDLARESRIGGSADRIEGLAKKFQALGVAMSGAAGAEGSAGMARGLGMLLSPAAMGAAAVGLLGLEMWDLNKAMSAANASIDRQAQLSDMNAKSLWSWGEAAKTVGANPQDITGGIASLQEAIAGMMVGASDATPQVMALSRLGIRWNTQNGMNDAQVTDMFTKVHQKAAAQNYKNLGQLRAQTRPFMNDAMFALAVDPEFNPANLKRQIEASAPANLNKILQDSLKSQMKLGQLDIDTDIIKETAYGGEQGLMQAGVDILRNIAGGLAQLVNHFVHPVSTAKKVYDATVDAASRGMDRWTGFVKSFSTPTASHQRMSSAMKFFTDRGIAASDAEAIVGNLARESSMNPLARNASGHAGYAQWDKARQADFARRYGYQIGSSAVSPDQQSNDQLQFVLDEFQTTQQKAWLAMTKAKDLPGKTRAFMDLYERPGDNSFAQRFGFALDAKQLANIGGLVTAANSRASPVSNHVTSTTHIGELNVNAPSTDPKAIVDAARKGMTTHPLMSAGDLSMLGLSTRGTTQ